MRCMATLRVPPENEDDLLLTATELEMTPESERKYSPRLIEMIRSCVEILPSFRPTPEEILSRIEKHDDLFRGQDNLDTATTEAGQQYWLKYQEPSDAYRPGMILSTFELEAAERRADDDAIRAKEEEEAILVARKS